MITTPNISVVICDTDIPQRQTKPCMVTTTTPCKCWGLSMQVLPKCGYIQRDSSQWGNWNHLPCRRASLPTCADWQLPGAG